MLKTIAQIYTDYYKLIKRNDSSIKSLQHLIYESYSQKFGLKHVAEKKIYNLFISAKRADDFPRIKMFAKLLNLYSEIAPMQQKEVEFYIKVVMLLDD